MFRLAKVLSWKERLEKEARVELAALEARQSRLEHDATQAAATRRSAPDAGEMSIDDLAAWAQYAESLRRRERQLREEAGRLTPEVEEKRQAHLVLRQEVEGLRKLQERAEKRAKQERERAAQAEMDDLAGRRSLPGGGNPFRVDSEEFTPSELDAPTNEAPEAEYEGNRGGAR